jgi:hypothetical protein
MYIHMYVCTNALRMYMYIHSIYTTYICNCSFMRIHIELCNSALILRMPVCRVVIYRHILRAARIRGTDTVIACTYSYVMYVHCCLCAAFITIRLCAHHLQQTMRYDDVLTRHHV